MPVSGLLLTLSRDSDERARAVDALRRHDAIEVGEAQDHRLPIVVDTRTSEDDRAVWDWLHTLPGVAFVDLVCVDMSEDEPKRAREEAAPSRGTS